MLHGVVSMLCSLARELLIATFRANPLCQELPPLAEGTPLLIGASKSVESEQVDSVQLSGDVTSLV